MKIEELSLVKSAKAAGWRRCVRVSACVAMAAQLAWTPLMAAGAVDPANAGSNAPTSGGATKAPDAVL